MRVVRRLLGLVLVLVLVLGVGAVGLLASITGRALPQVSGTLQVPGLLAPVTVTRDVNGIAQITADSPHDLFLAQGWLHASERLWQMEVWRRIGSGRLSELFGKSTLETDRFIRTLGWRQAARRDLDAISPDGRAALEAYAAGVNAYIDAHRGNLGLPFVVVGLRTESGGLGGYTPEPWTPLDSMTWQKVQAWNLGGNFDTEVFRMLADATLGDPKRTDELFPPYPVDHPIIVPTGTAAGDRATAEATAPLAPAPAPALTPALTSDEAVAWRDVASAGQQALAIAGLDTGVGLASDRGIGSNNWVVAPAKSASGGALLANDPHLGLGMPSVWYMNGLHCRTVSPACQYDVTGVSFPGDPGVILGHNERIAWGATNVNPDVQDLFVEKPDPANAGHYLFGSESKPFLVRAETIGVAGGPPATLTVRETVHGPIVNDVDPRLKDAPLLSLRWTATAITDGTFDAILAMDRATNWSQFRQALAGYGSPSQNFVYADVDGNIGYQMPGNVPIRQDPNDRGDRPRPGWDARHEWVGTIPYDDLSRLFDPPSGLIVSANNAVTDARFPRFIGNEYDPGWRALRIRQRLEAAAKAGGVTQADLSAIQMDDRVLRADLIVPKLDHATPATADGRLLLDRIRAWDRRCPVESLGCAAYMAYEYRVLRDVFDDDLGTRLAREYVGSPPSWQALIALLDRPDDAFWDDRSTPERETRDVILSRAADRAAAELRDALGDPGRWTWGRLHTITFREDTLGKSGIGPLEWILDSGPSQVAGAAGAVDNTYYRISRAYPDPDDPSVTPVGIAGVFEVTNGPSYRLAIDMRALDRATIVITTGNGGNPFDRHYGDMIDDWLHGQSVPLPFTPAAVERSAASTLSLVP